MCYGSVQHIAVLELASFMKKLQELLEDDYRIAGKFGGGKVWRIGYLEVLANIEDSH